MTTDLRSLFAAGPPIEVLYTDLDGTLLGPGGSLLHGPDGHPSLVAAAALVELRRIGVTVVPVSERTAATLRHDARLLGLADWIAEAGTVVCRAGEVHLLWGDAPRDLAGTPREALEGPILDALLAACDGNPRRYAPWDEGRVGEVLLHGTADTAEADAVLAATGAGWACLIDNGAASGWPGREVRAYHLLPRGTGKARAVAGDLATRGLRPEQAVAVGDSVEDATLATVVGTYVQVANGTAPLSGGVVAVDGAHDDGVALLAAAVCSSRTRHG